MHVCHLTVVNTVNNVSFVLKNRGIVAEEGPKDCTRSGSILRVRGLFECDFVDEPGITNISELASQF
jgi:hypothetical protein